jgi:toxin HigB-1
MQVRFRTQKLKREYEDARRAVRAYGDAVGRRYIERVNIIQSALDIDQLQRLPAIDCHPLKKNRKGDWAITLIGRMRLIFTLHGDNLEIAQIEKVSKHYGQ